MAAASSCKVDAGGATCGCTSGGAAITDTSIPGGGREQKYDVRNTSPAPAIVKEHQLAGISADYRAKVFADGIPPRPNGLFPPNDPLLRRLAADPHCRAFEKHLPGEQDCYELLLPNGGWATGDAAAARGVDLRLFYKEPAAGETYGTIQGAVRFGDGACIGSGYYMSAHGGSIETALDEATAELAKCEYVPMVTTRQATFQITKPVPLHTSLSITCKIKEQRGLRCYVDGQISAADDPQAVYATCQAMLVNLTDWLRSG